MSQSAKALSETLHRPKPTNELREFILDPKSSAKKFVETSISSSQPSQQPQQPDTETWSNFSHGSPQSHFAGPQLPQRRPHIRGRFSSYSDYTPEGASQAQEGNSDLAAPMASHPKPSSAMEYASFVASRPSSLSQEHAPAYSGAAPAAKEQRPVGPAPPPAETPAVTTLPAPRLYHRMITEYETIKAVFYSALIQPVHNDLSPLAAKLKSLCRDIWSIRYLSAAEFPYNEATTEERITEWKAQFEYWSDVLEDLLDARYVQRAAREARENDWAGLAGLAAGPRSAAAPTPKAAAPAADDEEEEPAAPVAAKKKATKAAAAEGDAAVSKKKKVAKKAAAV